MYRIEYNKQKDKASVLHDNEIIAIIRPTIASITDILIGMLNAQEITLKNLNFEIKPRVSEQEPEQIEKPEQEPEPTEEQELNINKQMLDLCYSDPFNGNEGNPPYYVYCEAEGNHNEIICRDFYNIYTYEDLKLLFDKMYEICKNKCDFFIFQQTLYEGRYIYARYSYKDNKKTICDIKEFYTHIEKEQNDKDIEVDND